MPQRVVALSLMLSERFRSLSLTHLKPIPSLLQQWVHERASILLYTYIACLVTYTCFSYTQQLLSQFFH
jgi:hypothetical protein